MVHQTVPMGCYRHGDSISHAQKKPQSRTAAAILDALKTRSLPVLVGAHREEQSLKIDTPLIIDEVQVNINQSTDSRLSN